MQDLIDAATYAVRDVLVAAGARLREGGPLAWVGLCLPMLLLDLPRLAMAAWTSLRAQPVGNVSAERAFLASGPRLSVVVPAYNESSGIEGTLRSLAELGHPDLQVVIVDDNSEDGMHQRIRPWSDRGDVVLVKNSAASGRGGKPAALNLGLVYATGDIVIFIDADSTVDRDLLASLIGPFHDPTVGAVAANVVVRNRESTLLTFLQAAEYALGIEMTKRWLDRSGRVLNASGACCAFRRGALRALGGSASTRGEDLDNSLMMRKGGWKVVFRAAAILRTEVPETLRALAKQRVRWDRDFVQIAFRKHADLLDPRIAGWAVSSELALQIALNVVLPYACVVWVAVMAARAPGLLALILAASLAIGGAINAIALAISLRGRPRGDREWRLVAAAPLLPVYSALVLAPVRLWSTTCELLRIRREDPYLPQSYWRNAELP
jgi:cellulose synthase/poly-beta-1,6-N-acetylglucosamine synthase-like glycosyltransferase